MKEIADSAPCWGWCRAVQDGSVRYTHGFGAARKAAVYGRETRRQREKGRRCSNNESLCSGREICPGKERAGKNGEKDSGRNLGGCGEALEGIRNAGHVEISP